MSDQQAAAVRNAGDQRQVQPAGRRDARRVATRAETTRAVLATYEGRAFVWDLLEQTGVHKSIWRQSAEIHYLAGRQDVGHQLRDQCLAADEGEVLRMELEARNRRTRETADIAAARSPRREEDDDQ